RAFGRGHAYRLEFLAEIQFFAEFCNCRATFLYFGKRSQGRRQHGGQAFLALFSTGSVESLKERTGTENIEVKCVGVVGIDKLRTIRKRCIISTESLQFALVYQHQVLKKLALYFQTGVFAHKPGEGQGSK